MKELDILPFGAQYYRAPTPLAEDWERDLERMAEAGFNLIKIWAVWRSNNPAEGIYDFRDIAALLELAEKHSLKVIVNAVFDAAPSWFYKKYPDSRMLTAGGRRIEPGTSACRQSGGAPGPCLHHPEGIRVRREFLEKLSRQFASHPALLAWDVWNEPFLGGGYESEMVCYCEHSFCMFVKWLEEKYGSVEALNSVWHTYYGSFDEVEMPVCREAFLNMIDWRLFFSDTLTRETGMRVQAVKKHDALHPVMVHTVPMPYFTAVNGCCDDYHIAKECDWFGNSLGSYPYTATISKSAAKGKTVISSEIHAVGGTTFGRPVQPDFDALKRHILIPLSRGIKGFCFWQYRPERLGMESPAWGLTRLDGTPSSWMNMAAAINRALQKYSSLILESEPREAEIAVVNSMYEHLFCYCADGGMEKYEKSVTGAFDLFYRENYQVDIISPDALLEGHGEGYRLLYLPFPYLLDSKLANLLERWVAAGGTLVSEAFFGAYSMDDGLHSTTVPGFGFDKVFGVEEGSVMTASQFRNAYSGKWSDAAGSDGVPMKREDGSRLYGHYFREELTPKGAKVLARYEDGTPSLTCHSYGKGYAVIAGSLLGAAGAKENRGLAVWLAELAGVSRNVEVSQGDVRIDFLGRRLCVICNDSGREVEYRLKLRGKRLKNILTEEEYDIISGSAVVPLARGGCECFVIE